MKKLLLSSDRCTGPQPEVIDTGCYGEGKCFGTKGTAALTNLLPPCGISLSKTKKASPENITLFHASLKKAEEASAGREYFPPSINK